MNVGGASRSIAKSATVPVEIDITDRTGRYVKINVSGGASWVAGSEFQVYIDRPQTWLYIQNARTSFEKQWSVSQMDQIHHIYTTTHSSYQPESDVDRWYYQSALYNTDGWWGTSHTAGSNWIDKYGFMHIVLDASGTGISTFDKPGEWAYLADAGYAVDRFGEDWSSSEIDELYDFWYAGNYGESNASFIEIDGTKWYYTDETFDGHNTGDYWINELGYKFIYFGSGLTTQLPSEFAIPEPHSIALLLMCCLSLLKKIYHWL